MSKQLERFANCGEPTRFPNRNSTSLKRIGDTAQAQLDQAEQNLRDSRLDRGKDGVVLARYINRASRFTRPARAALRRHQPDVGRTGIAGSLVGRLTPGKEIDVEISALEGMPPFRGRCRKSACAASGEGRLFRVVIKVPNPDGLLRSGMTARIRVSDAAGVKPGTVVVPLSALVTFAPGNAGGRVRRARRQSREALVKTGDILNSSILITEGLRAGEQLVTSGAAFLYDGAPTVVAGN
jgi:multidrug efflux pump subunit AcrA (membrane-fusion protein)